MSQLGQAIAFASRLYRDRAGVFGAGYLWRDPMALLQLRPGRVNPYAVYDRLRERGPLTPTRLGNWVSTSHRVCDCVLRDRRFGARPEDQPAGPDEFDLSFLGMNPPDHSRLRRLALPAFSPRAVATYQGRIERTVGDLLDQAEAAGRFDLVSGFAAPLPIAVITNLLGIPDSSSADFARHGMVFGSALDGIKSMRHARQLQASDVELEQLFENLFALRRREPRDDIVSRLVAAEGDQISPAEMLPMCNLLLVAGFETTVNLISNAVLALLGHPAQWRALCADPEGLAPRAVEEVLRWDPPVQRTGRVALESLELAGKPVRKGQLVVTLIGAANRDPGVYDRPDVFDIMRESGPGHLAFSSGIHYCLGQPLARLEATIALRTLAERMPGLTLAGRVKRRNATTIRGPVHVPVAVYATRLALSEGTASRNSGAVHERAANARLTASHTAPKAAAGTSASTEPPKPPPIIRPPSAPAASADSTATSASGQEISKSSRSD
jgi:P450-derived glycosyltransferase activator